MLLLSVIVIIRIPYQIKYKIYHLLYCDTIVLAYGLCDVCFFAAVALVLKIEHLLSKDRRKKRTDTL